MKKEKCTEKLDNGELCGNTHLISNGKCSVHWNTQHDTQNCEHCGNPEMYCPSTCKGRIPQHTRVQLLNHCTCFPTTEGHLTNCHIVKTLAVAPDAIAVLKAIAEQFNEGADKVYRDALWPVDDDKTLGQWINEVIAKAEGSK